MCGVGTTAVARGTDAGQIDLSACLKEAHSILGEPDETMVTEEMDIDLRYEQLPGGVATKPLQHVHVGLGQTCMVHWCGSITHSHVLPMCMCNLLAILQCICAGRNV